MALSFTTGDPSALGGATHVEAGDYQLIVLGASEAQSKAGSAMIKLELQVMGDSFPNGKGPKLFDYLVFSQNTFWKLDQFLKAVGRHPGAGEAIEIEARDLVGLELAATLKLEMYDGRMSNKVADYIWEEGF